MKVKSLAFTLFFTINFTISQSKTYENYMLYNVVPQERFQLKFLQNLENMKYIDVIFWTRPFKLYQSVQILVNPSDVALFEERLRHFALKQTVLTRNIQKLFDNQVFRRYIRMKLATFTWEHYHNLEDIYQWMADFASKNSKKVEIRAIGKSAEGREILALEFRTPKAKAKVFVEGAIHGCEWIAAEFVTFLANALVNANKSSNLRLKSVAHKYKWILIPVLNPDGYDYSTKFDRLWHKNRRPFRNGTFGVDLNKNFAYSFCKYDGSVKSNSDRYCGPRAFSEPETIALRNYVKQNNDKLNYFFSFHAYGQNIVIPYSDRIKHLENFSEMENYGKQAILKMNKVNGVKYSVGTIYDLYGYRSSGDSASWIKKNHKVKYAVTFNLRDNGTYGYALPSDKILPTCKETLTGLVELMTVRHKQMHHNSAVVLKFNYICFIVLFVFV